jgi:glycerophosphoryl diester phosphodiesterase
MRHCDAFLRPIAHRGLHGIVGRGAVENTMAAFVAARDKGYGIECDLRAGRGGLPLVFHDEALDRLIDGIGPVSRIGSDELASLPFRHAPQERIPTFAALLDKVAGAVPLLVEVKSEWRAPDREFLGEVARLARGYTGPIALMSFDPAVMAVLKALADDVPRGIVSGDYLAGGDGDHWWEQVISRERAERLTHLLESGPADPSFYAYHVKALPTAVTRYVRAVQGLPLFTWTVRDDADLATAREFADAPIFEGFLA